MTPDSEFRPSGADLASSTPQIDATDTVANNPTQLRSGPQRISGIRRVSIAALGALSSFGAAGAISPDNASAGGMILTAGASPVDCAPDTLLAQAQNSGTDISVTSAAIQDPNCPPTTENPQVEVEKDEIDQRLDAWLDGSFRTDLKIDEFFTGRGRYLPLNITDPNIINFPEDYEQAIVPFQGVLLTRETVQSDAGQEYDIYYFGLEGKNRERFFIGVNVGRAAEDATTTTGVTAQGSPNKPGDRYVSTLKLREQMLDNEGKVMLFTPSAALVERTVNPKFKERFDCMIPQQPLADEFIRYMAKVTTEDLDINEIPEDSLTKQYVINKRVEKYAPETTLFSTGITEMQPNK